MSKKGVMLLQWRLTYHYKHGRKPHAFHELWFVHGSPKHVWKVICHLIKRHGLVDMIGLDVERIGFKVIPPLNTHYHIV